MKSWFILALGRRLAFLFLLLSVLPAKAVEDAWAAAEQAAKQKNYELAVKKATEWIVAGHQRPEIFYYRGRWNFRLGHMRQSLADFDSFLSQRPGATSRLWERGITCYYAGKFAAGAKQFEQYQTYYSNDVENAVWRYLCQARIEGQDKARSAMLPIKFDRRIPMMEVYELFQGNGKADAVLERIATSEAEETVAREQRFNAHLYLGLFYDSEGDLAKARQHIDQAVKQYQDGHYMWAVAKQHQQHLRRRAKQAAGAGAPQPEREGSSPGSAPGGQAR